MSHYERDRQLSDTMFPGSAALEKDSHGNLCGHERNAAIALKTLESFLSYNLLTHEAGYVIHPPWHDPAKHGEEVPRIDDYQILQLTMYVQKWHIPAGKAVIADALDMVAREYCSFHPVQQYFDSLLWDGIPRVDNLLSIELGAEDSGHSRFASRSLLIGGVARAYDPGCKVDTCVVLVGEQGTLKSTAIEILGEPWYCDGLGADGKLDAQACLVMGSKFVVELGDIDQYISGPSGRRLKSLLSRRVDVFKRPYGRMMSEQPRGCIFVGTTNSDYFLRDSTGNRRFIPIRCWERPNHGINVNSLRRMKDQYWAEAVQLYRDGAPHYPEGKAQCRMLADKALEYTVPHIADEAIDEYLLGHSIHPGHLMGATTVAEIVTYIAATESWKSLLGLPSLKKYIPNHLRDLGYKQRRGNAEDNIREPSGRQQRSRGWFLDGE